MSREAVGMGAEVRPHGPRRPFRPRSALHGPGHLDSGQRGEKALTLHSFAPYSAPDMMLRVDSFLTASFTCNKT